MRDNSNKRKYLNCDSSTQKKFSTLDDKSIKLLYDCWKLRKDDSLKSKEVWIKNINDIFDFLKDPKGKFSIL